MNHGRYGALAAAALLAAAASTSAHAQTTRPVTKSFAGPAQQIPDVQTTTSNINLPSYNVSVTGVTVTINTLRHTHTGDLKFAITHGSKTVVLYNRECYANVSSGVTLTFADGYATTCPSRTMTRGSYEPLSAFNGMSAAGVWTLTIYDLAGGDFGQTGGWTLGLTYNGYESGYHWSYGNWSAWSSTCGAATRTRTASCLDDTGAAYPEGACSSLVKEAVSESATQTSGCTYAWNATAFSQVSACGPTTDRRTVTCRRSDGTTVEDTSCPSASRPAATQPSATPSYASCTYEWQLSAYGPWSTTCGSATRTRTKTCIRSDGTPVSGTVSQQEAYCGDGPYYVANSFRYAEPLSETAYFVSGCTFAWRTGEWATTPACGATDESRPVRCTRSDGVAVDDASCNASGIKPATRRAAPAGTTSYSACTYAWIPSVWSPIPSTTCGYAQRTRTLSCVRSDGKPADQAMCPTYRPDTTAYTLAYPGCTYAWRQSGYTLSQCVNSSQTYTARYSCRRSGTGDWVDASYCTDRQPTFAKAQACTYWRDHANDPYADALPTDARPTSTYSTGGTNAGTGQAPPPQPAAGQISGAPGAHAAGTGVLDPATGLYKDASGNAVGNYNKSTGVYTTPTGEQLEGGYYDDLTNTYWDSPEFYRRWQALGTGKIIMRKLIVKE
jgi:subtilisin-like proprotein convertase family protein